MTTGSDVIQLIKYKEVKWADLRFTDTRGKEQHVTIPAKAVDEGLFRDVHLRDEHPQRTGDRPADTEGCGEHCTDGGARRRPGSAGQVPPLGVCAGERRERGDDDECNGAEESTW